MLTTVVECKQSFSLVVYVFTCSFRDCLSAVNCFHVINISKCKWNIISCQGCFLRDFNIRGWGGGN